MLCTTDCGWMTTSSRSGGQLNSQRASISSKPLFIMVEESTEIFCPIDQLGCLTACAGVMAGKSVKSVCKNEPPLAVRMMEAIPCAFRLPE